MTNRVLFRCDGVGQFGHLTRCIALAEAMREIGWFPTFRSVLDQTGRSLLAAADLEVVPLEYGADADDAGRIAADAAASRAAWIVLDGYGFTPDYAERLARDGVRIAVIDDFAAWPRYPVSAVLNFTLAADTRAYPATSARLLLGPKYFLARTSLRRQRITLSRTGGGVSRLCVVLSGDVDGAKTAAALAALGPGNLHVRPVIAAGAGNRDRCETALAGMGAESRLRIIPHDLSADLAWADAVLCTGGLIKYEAIFLGAFPLAISNTEGEAGDTAAWLSRGIGDDLGLMSNFDQDRIAQAVRRIVAADPASLRDASRRGQEMFMDDPTLRAAHALSAISSEIRS